MCFCLVSMSIRMRLFLMTGRSYAVVNVEYKAALTHFTQSGTCDSSFYNFCNGKPDVYYLRRYLELKSNLNNTVEADLPEDCAILSDMTDNFKVLLVALPKESRAEMMLLRPSVTFLLLQCNQSWQSNGCFTWKKN